MNSEKPETVSAMIYSEEREDDGITVELTETADSSGIFEGTMFFTTTDVSSGHRLYVIPGEMITAEYLYASEPSSGIFDIEVGHEVLITGIPSLKIQLDRDISFQDLQCPAENHVLVSKYDGSPACVNSQSFEKLVERGWANS